MNGFDTVVILAAGRGSRMGGETPKVLLEVAGKPILQHVIDYWKDSVTDFVFVCGKNWERLTNYIAGTGLDHWTFIEQPEPRGIADAVHKTMNIVSDKFIVALGDCVQVGHFDYPANLELGCGIWATPYQKYLNQGCRVKVSWKGDIHKIIEKDDADYPGIGTYFFDKRVFKYIKETKPSTVRNEVEISDVMENMIEDKLNIKAVPFYGDYINFTTPADVVYAEKLFDLGVKIKV
jgi:dTDP-glucose pyrophosphorylase